MKLLQSSWVVALLGSACYLGMTVVLLQPQRVLKDLPRSTHEAHKAEMPPGGIWDFHNPEVDQLIAELKKEKQDLAAREQELKELASRLQAERTEINQATQVVHLMQREFDQNVLRVKDEEPANLKKLAKLYTAMSPESAVAILKELADDDLVKILTFMKDTDTAAYLELLAKPGESDKKRVVALIERLRMTMYRSSTNKNNSPP